MVLEKVFHGLKMVTGLGYINIFFLVKNFFDLMEPNRDWQKSKRFSFRIVALAFIIINFFVAKKRL